MRRLLIALSILLLSVSSSGASAQAELPPLLILNDGGIYAISPQDGAIVETLVAPPEDYEALNAAAADPVNYFSAEWISPDGQLLAYRTLGGGEPLQAGGDPVFTHNLALLHLNEGGDPIMLTLTDDEEVSVEFDSVAWSNDGAYLYVLIATRTPRQSDPDWTVVVFQRDQWDTPNLIPLEPTEGTWVFRNIFAAEENAFVVFDWSVRDGSHAFTMYSPSGEMLNTFSVTNSLSPDVNMYTNATQLNPLVIEGSTRYGFSNILLGDMLLYQADLMTGEISEMEAGYFSSLVSLAAPDTSIHVSLINFDGEIGGLNIHDAEGTLLEYVEGVRLVAYGVQGNTWGSTFTVSPDGHAVAFLREGTVNIWRDGVLTALNVNARVIAWQAPLVVPVYDEQALRMFLG